MKSDRIKINSFKGLELRDLDGFIQDAIEYEQQEKRTGKIIPVEYVINACISDLKILARELFNYRHYTEYVNLGTESLPCWLYNNEKEEMQWNEKEDFENSLKLLVARIGKIQKFLNKHIA